MSQTIRVTSVDIDNNPTTGKLDIKFSDGVDSAAFSLEPTAAVGLVNLLMLRLLQHRDPEVRDSLQNFAITEIEAKTMPDGRPYLEYHLENGLGFGSGLELEKLRALHHQLGTVLAKFH